MSKLIPYLGDLLTADEADAEAERLTDRAKQLRAAAAEVRLVDLRRRVGEALEARLALMTEQGFTVYPWRGLSYDHPGIRAVVSRSGNLRSVVASSNWGRPQTFERDVIMVDALKAVSEVRVRVSGGRVAHLLRTGVEGLVCAQCGVDLGSIYRIEPAGPHRRACKGARSTPKKARHV